MDGSDAAFIDFGSSVNVNDELRRQLQTETTEIDHQIKSLQASIATEESTCTQLNKDYTHSLQEMLNLSRGAEENQDNALVKEQIQLKLKECLQEQQRILTCPELDEDDGPSIDSNELTAEEREQKNDEGALKNGHRSVSMKLHAEKSAAEIKRLACSIKQSKESKVQVLAQCAEIQYQLDALSNCIEREQKSVSTWNQDVAKEMRENGIMKERKKNTMEVLQRTRVRMGENTQQYTNESNKLLELQTNHQMLEDEWNTDYHTLEASVNELKRELELLSSEEEERNKSIVSILSDLEEYEKVQTELTSYQDQLIPNQEHVRNLTLSEQKLTDELKKINDERVELMKEKTRQEAAKEEIDKMTFMNDEADEKELKAANKEYSTILEETDRLARSIAFLQDSHAASKKSLASGFSSDQQVAQDLEAKITEKEKYIKSKSKEIETVTNSISEIKESSANDIIQFDDLCVKFVDAKSAQVAIIQALSAQREKEKKELKQSICARSSNESLKLEAMDCAIEMLIKADELESELQNIQMFA